MSGQAAPVATSMPGNAQGRTSRRRPNRFTVALVLLLLFTLAVMLWAGRGTRTGYLDPAAVNPEGSRAVAEVLGNNGVSVQPTQRTADVLAGARGATVLVTDPTILTSEVVDQLLAAGPARLVLVGDYPGTPTLNRLGAGIDIAEGVPPDVVEPGCDYLPAVRAGSAKLPGVRYDTRAWVPRAQACYDTAQSAALVVIPAGSGRPEVVLLGSAAPLRNDGFAEQGNASLILSLLGSQVDLIWWQPSLSDPAIADTGGQTPLMDLLPAWVVPVSVQLFMCALALAWWRSRRMGPLVREPLPVVIHAGETTAGTARLLQASHARGTAAQHLRTQAITRVRVALGLPPQAPRETVVSAVVDRCGQPPAAVEQLLYGGEPATDSQLVELQANLTNLVQEVART